MKKISLALRLDLRKLILMLTILSVSGLFSVSIFIVNYVVKQQLIQNSLEVNAKYALKVATSANQYFEDMLKELGYSAELLGQNSSNDQINQQEVYRLKNQSHKFNSVFIVNKDKQTISFEPPSLNPGQEAVSQTLGTTESLMQKKTYISPPYWSLNHNLIVLMSQPIYDKNRNYLGFVGGTIFLQNNNVMINLIPAHYEYKNNYMYVIDQENKIVFHPNTTAIGEKIPNHSGLEYVKRHKAGHLEWVNNQGVENLVGFATIPSVNWIVVYQQPTKELLKDANTIILKVSVGIFLFYIFVLFLIWRLARFISMPLNSLAKMASMLNQPDIQEEIKQVNPWYFEVLRFRRSLLQSSQSFQEKITELHHYVHTDALTGLYNRRGLKVLSQKRRNEKRAFAVLVIDIDFFKRINDTFGHDQGDKALITLAGFMKENFRQEDICCRVGGEEFLVLIMTADLNVAYNAAERLRKKMEDSNINGMGPITISIGIAFWPKDSEDFIEVCKIADKKMFEAKNKGRNRVCY